jgi:hypothetical protein
MAEKVSLLSLVKELITDDNSLVNQYNTKQQEFHCSTIDTSNQEKLDKEYLIIKELLLKFQENYRQLFKIAIKESTLHDDKITARAYIEINQLYLNIIQNLYLNPINYRLNKINTEKRIKKANCSIYIGIASILIGVIISIWSSFGEFTFDSNSENDINDKMQIIEKSDSCETENSIDSLKEALSPIDIKK